MKLPKQNRAEPQEIIMCQFIFSRGLALTHYVLKGVDVSCFRDVLHLSWRECCNLFRLDCSMSEFYSPGSLWQPFPGKALLPVGRAKI